MEEPRPLPTTLGWPVSPSNMMLINEGFGEEGVIKFTHFRSCRRACGHDPHQTPSVPAILFPRQSHHSAVRLCWSPAWLSFLFSALCIGGSDGFFCLKTNNRTTSHLNLNISQVSPSLPCVRQWLPCLFFDICCCAYKCGKLGHRGAFGRDIPHPDVRHLEPWTRDNDNRIAAWNAQLEQNRAEQEAQERIANEEEEAPASPMRKGGRRAAQRLAQRSRKEKAQNQRLRSKSPSR